MLIRIKDFDDITLYLLPYHQMWLHSSKALAQADDTNETLLGI